MNYLLAWVQTDESPSGDPLITNESCICLSLDDLRAKAKELAESETILVTRDDFEVYTLNWDEALDTEICEFIDQIKQEADLARRRNQQERLRRSAERERAKRHEQYLKLKAEFEPVENPA